MIDPTKDFVAMLGFGLLLLFAVLYLGSVAAAQLVPNFRALPRPYLMVLGRRYDGAWAQDSGLKAWAPVTVGVELASIVVLQGVWITIAVWPPFFVPRSDSDLVRIEAGIESVIAVVLLARLTLVVRALRREAAR